MNSNIIFQQEFDIKGGDFINGGDAACQIGSILKELGIDPEIILRCTVAAYEAEMNAVIYADKGNFFFSVNTKEIVLIIEDQGKGIKNIELAMTPGYSTATEKIREMGFGAGMGLPNIKKNADFFNINSVVDSGTILKIIIDLPEKNE